VVILPACFNTSGSEDIVYETIRIIASVSAIFVAIFVAVLATSEDPFGAIKLGSFSITLSYNSAGIDMKIVCMVTFIISGIVSGSLDSIIIAITILLFSTRMSSRLADK